MWKTLNEIKIPDLLLVGLVVGQGFKALIKPESWAASHAADHVVRKAS